MAKKKLYRTVIRFEVISEEPINPVGITLGDIDEMTTDGHCSGRFLASEAEDAELVGKKAVKVVNAHGTDVEFFNMDNEGNEIEE